MSTLEVRGGGDGGDSPLVQRSSPRTDQPLYRPPGRRRAAAEPSQTAQSAAAAAAADRRPPRQLYVPPRGRRHGLNRASSPGFSTCSEIVTSWRTAPDAGPARPPPGPRRRISQQTRQHVERLVEASTAQEEGGSGGSPQHSSPSDSPGKRPGRRRRRGGRRSRSSSEDRSASGAVAADAAVGPSFQVPMFPLSPTATAPRPANVPWRSNAASGRFTPTPERETTARPPPPRPRFQQPYQPPAMRDRPASAAAELPPSPQRDRSGPDSPQRRMTPRGHDSPQHRGHTPRDSPRRDSGQENGAQNWRRRADHFSPPTGGRHSEEGRSGRRYEQRGADSARPELRLSLDRSAPSPTGPAAGPQRSPPDCPPPSAATPRRRSGGGGGVRSPSDIRPSPRAAADDSPMSGLGGTGRDAAEQRPAPGGSPPIAAAPGGSGSERAATGGAGGAAALPAGRYDHLVNTTDDEKVSLSARGCRAPADPTARDLTMGQRESNGAKDDNNTDLVSKDGTNVREGGGDPSSVGCDSSSGVVTDGEDVPLADSGDDGCLATVQTDWSGATQVPALSASPPTESRPSAGRGREGVTTPESAAVPSPRKDCAEMERAPAASRRRSSASSARSSSVTYEQIDWAEEMEEWEKNYTDDGDPTAKVAPPTPRPVIDYLAWRPPSPPSPPAGDDSDPCESNLPTHVLEVYDFPSSFTTQDLTVVFQEFGARGFDIRWVDDTHALAVFSSAGCVAEALLKQHPMVRCRPLSQASPRARQKATRCQQAESLRPHRPRPETCALQARRMVFTALGRRDSAPREQREQERRQLQTARDKKRLAIKQKQDAWEGNF